MSYWAKKLEEKILSHDVTIGIIGLGYVGRALGELIIQKDFSVIGFEKSKKHEIPYAEKYIALTTDTSRLKECDIIIICVQTPIYKDKSPNLEFLQKATKEIGSYLRRGQLITIESSINPGVTRDIVLPYLEVSGLTPEEDFFLSFSPERIDPGNKKFLLEEIPKVVSGLDTTSLHLIKFFYEKVFKMVVPVSSLETAEMVKIFENTFRFINISLVNELKEYTENMGIDLWEVIQAAATKPFGFMPHYPGPGVGGHCIPVDPFYLYNDAERQGIHIDMIHTAGVINDRQPVRIVEHTLQIMDKNTKGIYDKTNTEQLISLTPQLFSPHFYKNPMTIQGIKGGTQYIQVTDVEKRKYKILLIGITYKPNIDDIRESAALKIWDLFEEKGHFVSYHDPYIHTIRNTASLPLTEELLEGQDIFVIITNHQNIDYTYLTTFNKPIVDTQHVYNQKLPNIYYV